MGEWFEYGPWYYYRFLVTEPLTLEFLMQERHNVIKQLHGRKRLQASVELCEYWKFMVGCLQRGSAKDSFEEPTVTG
jgi:hypothetical protein